MSEQDSQRSSINNVTSIAAINGTDAQQIKCWIIIWNWWLWAADKWATSESQIGCYQQKQISWSHWSWGQVPEKLPWGRLILYWDRSTMGPTKRSKVQESWLHEISKSYGLRGNRTCCQERQINSGARSLQMREIEILAWNRKAGHEYCRVSTTIWIPNLTPFFNNSKADKISMLEEAAAFGEAVPGPDYAITKLETFKKRSMSIKID